MLRSTELEKSAKVSSKSCKCCSDWENNTISFACTRPYVAVLSGAVGHAAPVAEVSFGA